MSNARPLVTLGIVTYNHAHLIRDGVRGALRQTYSPLEIVISDDCSTDETTRVIDEELSRYEGPHEVRVRVNATNVGFGENLNRLVAAAKGEVFVVAAGDDVSLPQRVERIMAAYHGAGGSALSLFSNATVIDAAGHEEGLYVRPGRVWDLSAAWLATRHWGVIGCTQAWHRSVFDVFGPLHPGVVQEDHILPFRAAMLGEVAYIDEPLVLYRHHGGNMKLTETKEIRSVDHYLTLVGRHARSNVLLYENMLSDVKTAARVSPERLPILAPLEPIVLGSLRDMRCEQGMFEMSRVRRLRTIATALLHGTRVRRACRWLLWFVVPELYLCWLRTASAVRQNRAAVQRRQGKTLTWAP